MFYMLFFSLKLNQELTPNGMSETVKVVCYKCKTLANGEKPLMIRICKDGKKRYVSLGISIKEELWNLKKNTPKSQCPNRERICLVINKKICEIQKALLDKKIVGKDFTATTLIEAVGLYKLEGFRLGKQTYQLAEYRLSEKMCTFAHRYRRFVAETKVTKRAEPKRGIQS